jgi:hypothetical protein
MGHMGPMGQKVALLFVGSIGFHTPKRRHAVTPVRPHAHLPLVSLILIPLIYLVTNRFGGYAMVLRCRFTATQDVGRSFMQPKSNCSFGR